MIFNKYIKIYNKAIKVSLCRNIYVQIALKYVDLIFDNGMKKILRKSKHIYLILTEIYSNILTEKNNNWNIDYTYYHVKNYYHYYLKYEV